MLSTYIRGIFRGASRAPMTGKRGHNYFKGTRTGAMGRHTNKGGYKIEWSKVRTYHVPDMTDCKFKPYVSHRSPQCHVTIEDQKF
ncbi:60S ribosomal protein L27, mitochondrial [Dimargaris cristalligena]|uniref:Mitochondrial ribosomal protein L27-domain-containing protein n=1 Tax=Dimargaris cristalligena TaxID=215637 RepID=A0A4V1J4V3_9FUNG|nr:60S ribosomal protein L27, mitochondrial [Dimargaris cristalligena]RKP36859.1 mitochondrial ribosomal protein L27-domain-containing protein [Dimargaris cristalligena]|eukprot:RKP36859.1 mitochondrial ribosomal protein L27-domain-containing protein [Dimargaris cristalligena]